MATTGAKEIFSTDGVIPDYRFSSIPGEGGAVAEVRDAGQKKNWCPPRDSFDDKSSEL